MTKLSELEGKCCAVITSVTLLGTAAGAPTANEAQIMSAPPTLPSARRLLIN